MYDPRQSLFCNTVHMYLWLILFAAPMMISMFFTINVFLMTVYSTMVGIVFVITKTIVWLLNYVFDKYEPSDELPMSSVIVVDDCNLKDGVPKEHLKECMIEEIKRLLEEIIESHPEALQAIESVRQSKLKSAGLMDLNKYPKDLLDSLIQDRLIGHHENKADSCQLSAISSTSSEVGSDSFHKILMLHICVFKDLEGNWWSYTFSSNGTGTAQSLGTCRELKSRLQRFYDAQPSGPSSSRRLTVYRRHSAGNGSTSSEESLLAGMPSSVFHPIGSEVAGNPARAQNVATSRGRRAFAMPGRSVRTGLNQMRVFGNMALLFRRPNVSGSEIATKKVCYSVPLPVRLFGRKHLKIHFDRLRLSSLFDRNLTWISLSADVALAVVVSVIAFLLLMKPYYRDFGTLFLCFSAAGAQFCLLKSVQPDAASPVHGYNSIVPYSRPVYFSVFGTLIILIDPLHSSLLTLRDDLPDWHSRLDSISAGLNLCQEVLVRLILFLPLLFTLGVLPQLNTFCCYLLEQVDMHIFGGTACFSLVSAIYCCARSILCVAVLFLFGYLSISRTGSSQSVLFSAFCGFMAFFSYLLSRSTSNPKPLFGCLRSIFQTRIPLSKKRQARRPSDRKELIGNRILELRLRNNFFLASCIGLLAFALHCSTVFTMFPTILGFGFSIAVVIIGAVAHYLLPQLRKHTPCIFLSRPVLKTKEYGLFDVNDIAKVMWFERLFAWLHCIECHVFYPTVIISFVTNNSGSLFLSLGFSLLVTLADGSLPASHLILTFYLCSMLLPKLRELILKLRFIFAYVAPWQISWGSAFHAFAQPCAISHSAFTLVITAVSSLLSAPLNPFMGSSVFLMSYVRPVKFWEKDYNTRHLDNSNTRLATQIDRGPTTDDSNLNAIFYEHLTRSLQQHLAGDLALGRFASELEPGDCFILASFYLNCLIHVIEIGNGFVTFQLRGLEFRGTYCQQREVEAITEDISDVDGCCCAGDVCRLPGFVTWNAAWNMRWLAWEIKTARYILDGYSVTDNSAISLFQVSHLIELRKLLITLYVKCIIYFAIKSNRITDWLQLESIIDVLDLVQYNPEYVDVDPTFCYQNDEDYDVKRNGISYESFCVVYLSWITCCADRSPKSLTEETKYGNQVRKMVVALCYLLSLFGRRLLGAAAQSHTTNAESFLYGLHALFKGDFRITCSRDEWVFSDIDILSGVVAPAVRMALKLHQDQFTYAEDFDDNVCLYNLINGEGSTVFISHENDPAWRDAVLSNTAKLLALRHVSEDGLDDFKIIMLNKRFVSFRVIKLNRECVRAFWAGQQQELVFLRNGNPERGSIQNARQVLRNIINSSADQPIGYPIYVSPLTTSYSETHPQISSILGPVDLFKAVSDKVILLWRYLQLNCGMSGSSAINTVDQGFCQRSCTLPAVAIELQHIKGRTPTECSTLRRSNLSLPMIEEGRSTASSLLHRSSTHPVDRSISAQMLIRSSHVTVGCCRQCILSTAIQNRNSCAHSLCSKQCCTKSSAVTW
ncbi:pecanex protein 1 [Trichuris trichiura]|uniref:Pecanex-like protein n=1 Tax=Trichuris trichiura TaxID=36087 RepID=A0A077Z6C8_TRITR|nr:pecanex protein 1 [Trichuris trichiura]